MSKQHLEDAVASYEVDYYRWTQDTAELIRQGRLNEADLEHVAEEIADMGKRDRREVRSRLVVLVMHLLKWQLQPGLREESSWRATIMEQRRQLRLVLSDSPSLHQIPENELPLVYVDTVAGAIEETRLPPESFPAHCPYSAREILESGFFPDGPFRPAGAA
jgi:hypothetical protein